MKVWEREIFDRKTGDPYKQHEFNVINLTTSACNLPDIDFKEYNDEEKDTVTERTISTE